MTEPSKGDRAPEPSTLLALVADRVSAADRKFLLGTPVKSWPKVRLVFVSCEESGELVELISEMNRVMRVCPAIIMSRTRKGDIGRDEGTDGYSQLHDALHGVRNAQHTMLLLAGQKVPEPLAAKDAVLPGPDRPAKPGGTSPEGGEAEGVPAGPPQRPLAIARPERP
jgi:hypothetical protein